MLEKLCIKCNKNYFLEGRVYCGPSCLALLRIGAPKLISVPMTHYMARKIEGWFQSGWKHTTTKPTLQYIYAIFSTEHNDRMYSAYQDGVENQRQFAKKSMTRGNEQYRWHGSSRACQLGEHGQTTFCKIQTCGTCGIIKSNFDVHKFKRWGRFGKGIYSSQTTSKSHQYTNNLQDPKSPWSALLLNSVVVGNTYPTKQNLDSLLEPPDGFDSVYGQPGTQSGSHLNYDETVVYRNDAIRPTYLVLYLTPQ
ncbi:hypothetical protein M408DRAFT_69587 [Serendipita vermifera MAFF 305830]|uniref:PARP catalytic domain-containing protein n=1 Tax=Serendipita vermifera MAFF 305830 TaxID=933852 RepID=A0A0C3AVA8_SERVB|nr:hypothetical protein M408DRAFT_69587 [Serendipita vermifera MAFF 305830]